MNDFKFNLGDKVTVNGGYGYRSGETFVILDRGVKDDMNWYADGLDTGHWPGVFEHRLSLTDPAPEETAIDPGYYQFPGGHEVRHISAHLTSFGGQAVQYVARSTRLDGKNKGDTVENLQKAIKFLEWEIERLEGE